MIKNLFKERGNPLFRLIDRYLGIPLIFILGLVKKKRTIPHFSKKHPLNIAILLTSGIGDTVLFSGVIQDIRKAYPKASITLFSGSSNFEMASLLPVKAIKLPIMKPFTAIYTIIKEGKFDIWLDGNPWPRVNAFYTFFAKSRIKIGFRTSKQHRHYIYDKTINHLINRHEIDNYRALIEPFVKSTCSRPFVYLSEQKVNKSACVLHLFSGGSRAYLKQWPEERWVELIEDLTSKSYTCYLTGSQMDRISLEKIFNQCSHQSLLKITAGEINLKKTAELLKSSVFVVSVDTGIMHLAAALGCKVISLHGPTSFARWGAIGRYVFPITNPKKYVPCIHLGFENYCNSNQCMKEITVKRVKLEIENVLKKWGAPESSRTNSLRE